MDADRVVGGLRWRIRHAEERMLALRRVHQDVEIVVADLGIVQHERQVAVDEAGNDAGCALRAHRAYHVQRRSGLLLRL